MLFNTRFSSSNQEEKPKNNHIILKYILRNNLKLIVHVGLQHVTFTLLM